MKAIIFQDVETLRCESVPEPTLTEAGDVLVRVIATAVCGSDLHVYHGRETGLDVGTVLGHEFTGEVVAVGAGVHTLQVGDRVAGPFSTSCGACFYCRRDLTSRCAAGELFGWMENGRGLHGTQAELLRVPLADGSLVPLPDDISIEEAVLLGDVMSTGFFCAEMSAVGKGDDAAVLGCGPVGLMAVLGARARGVTTVLAVDSVPERLALAEQFGAVPIDREHEEPVEAARLRTDGRGVDAVLECVGSPGATRLAVDMIRPGGTVAAAGVHTEATFAFSPVEAYDKNLTYRAGRCPARVWIDRLLPVVREHRHDLAALFTHRMALADGVEAYDLFAARRDGCIKVLLTP